MCKPWWSAGALAAALVVSVPLAAQTHVEKACVRSLHDSAADDTPDALLGRTKPLWSTGKWVESVDSVIVRFTSASRGASPDIRARVRARLDSLRATVASGALPGSATNASSFNPQRGASGNYRVFPGVPASEIVLTDSTSADVVTAVCYAVMEAADIANLYALPAQEAFVSFLGERVKRWDNYRQAGPPVFLVEQVVNDWTPLARWWRRTSLEPPSGRALFLHPEVALSTTDPLNASPAFHDALVVELLGGVWYNGQRTQFFSASFASLYASGSSPQWGGAVRLSKYGQLGVYFGKTNSASISASLIQYGSRARAQADSAMQSLRDAAAACQRAWSAAAATHSLAAAGDCRVPRLP